MSTDQRRKNGGTKPVRANRLNLLDTKKALTMGIAIKSLGSLAGAAAAIAVLRQRALHWGATKQERLQALPGDKQLPTVDLSSTRAVTIDAAPEKVWPWIAQLGQGRGGFYSYDWLENLVVRADIHNADHVVPRWQHLSVGDEVRLAPEVPLTVAELEPGAALVLRGSVPIGQGVPPYAFTWAFVLVPQGAATRLVVRERYQYTGRWAASIVQPAALVSCLMSPKMLRTIKNRAECEPPLATQPLLQAV